MRFLLIALVLMLCGCQPAPRLDEIRDQPIARPVVPVPAAVAPKPSVIAPSVAPFLSRKTIHGILFEGVCFDSRSHRLAVIDQPLGPGSSFATARDVVVSQGALAAMNAGFFTPEGKPLGLVISKGNRTGSWNSASSLGSGIFAESADGRLSISRRQSQSSFADARELIQAGPLLIEQGRAVGGLDRQKIAVRSLLFTDGGFRWWIGKTSPCTLAALGEALASASPAGWSARHALNLDGGRSTDLFVSSKIPGGPIERRGFLNRPVRNFLLLQPR